jgi:hypothetical protein
MAHLNTTVAQQGCLHVSSLSHIIMIYMHLHNPKPVYYSENASSYVCDANDYVGTQALQTHKAINKHMNSLEVARDSFNMITERGDNV